VVIEMKNRKTKEENWAQAEAFRRMHGNELELIRVYAADFRTIITEYEIAHEGHVPTADELLWLESERRGWDITQ
jgi:hypothetical protein